MGLISVSIHSSVRGWSPDPAGLTLRRPNFQTNPRVITPPSMEAWNIDNGSAMHPGGKPIRLPANHHNSKSCWQTPDVCFQISIIRTSHMFVSISGWSMINGKSYMLLQHSICNTYRFTILSDMFTGPSVNATISWGSVPPFSKKTHPVTSTNLCWSKPRNCWFVPNPLPVERSCIPLFLRIQPPFWWFSGFRIHPQ